MKEQNDLLPEETDEQNQRTIQHLQRMYRSRTEVAQSLARVHDSLFSAENVITKVDTPVQHPAGTLEAKNQPRIIRRGSLAYRASHSRLTSLVAVLVVALLVGSFFFVTSHQQQHRGNPARIISMIPTNVPATVAGVGSWNQIHMFSTTTGWVIATNGLVRTTDGGMHWRAIFQCIPKMTNTKGHSICMASFDSAISATFSTVIMDGSQFKGTLISHTPDGGHTFHNAMLNAYVIQPATFVDALHGWVMTESGAKWLTLFRTIDGGETWQRVAPGPPINGLSGMTFRDASTGWITSTIKTNVDTSGIIQTRDGGNTWQSVQISLPANNGISPIVFFNRQEGLFLLNTTVGPGNDSISTTIYTTQDGGKTWVKRGFAPYYLQHGDFSDLNHVRLQSPNPLEKALYSSSDGGLHWSKIPVVAPFENIISLSFVSPTVGLALASNGSYPGAGASGLFKSIDGGHTWHEVIHLVQGQ